MAQVDLRTKDARIEAALQFTGYGPEIRGTLTMYLVGDSIAVHAMGGGHNSSLYLPIEPLNVEVK